MEISGLCPLGHDRNFICSQDYQTIGNYEFWRTIWIYGKNFILKQKKSIIRRM